MRIPRIGIWLNAQAGWRMPHLCVSITPLCWGAAFILIPGGKLIVRAGPVEVEVEWAWGTPARYVDRPTFFAGWATDRGVRPTEAASSGWIEGVGVDDATKE